MPNGPHIAILAPSGLARLGGASRGRIHAVTGRPLHSIRRIKLSQAALRIIIIFVGIGLLCSVLADCHPLPLIMMAAIAMVAWRVVQGYAGGP